MATLEEFQAEYRVATTERERAEIELAAWGALKYGYATKDTDGRVARPQSVSDWFGVPRYGAIVRQRLLGYGDAALPLWERVEADMVLATAAQLAHQAVKTRARGETAAHSVLRVLRDYDALPHVRNEGGNGKVVRKGRKDAWTPGRQPREPTAAAAPDAAPESGEFTDRSFWKALRPLVRQYVSFRLDGVSEKLIADEVSRLETELKILFEQFSVRIQNQRRSPSLASVFSKRDFNAACRVLHLDPPRGEPDAAFKKKAQKQFKALARQYHPDNVGSDVTQQQFDAVMKAWRVIESFLEQQKDK